MQQAGPGYLSVATRMHFQRYHNFSKLFSCSEVGFHMFSVVEGWPWTY